MVSATTFTTAPHDHPVDVLVGHARRFEFLPGSSRFCFPEPLFQLVQSTPQPQELFWSEFLSSSNDVVNGSHAPIPLVNCLRLGPGGPVAAYSSASRRLVQHDRRYSRRPELSDSTRTWLTTPGRGASARAVAAQAMSPNTVAQRPSLCGMFISGNPGLKVVSKRAPNCLVDGVDVNVGRACDDSPVQTVSVRFHRRAICPHACDGRRRRGPIGDDLEGVPRVGDALNDRRRVLFGRVVDFGYLVRVDEHW
jgi:hypothetical protein